MNEPLSPRPRRRRRDGGIRRGVVFAAVMLALAVASRLAQALGWRDEHGEVQRTLMVLVCGFLVLTGNEMPTLLPPLASLGERAGRMQALMRFAGWTWVLAGLVAGISWLTLPRSAAIVTTQIVMPAAVLLVLARVLAVCGGRRRPA